MENVAKTGYFVLVTPVAGANGGSLQYVKWRISCKSGGFSPHGHCADIVTPGTLCVWPALHERMFGQGEQTFGEQTFGRFALGRH